MMSIITGHRIRDQRGAFMVIFALLLLVLLGFVALGIEGGRWFLVRAELAKGVDAAALQATRNISNPLLNPLVLAQEIGKENFQAGYVGTPSSGAGAVQFTATKIGTDRISVTGNVSATVVLAQLFGINSVPVTATSVAQKKDSEIMMILDRSGSMSGQKMTDLKTAAIGNAGAGGQQGFIDYFRATQDKDKVGLVSFATSVGKKISGVNDSKADVSLGINTVNAVETAVLAMNATGGTNTGGALAMAGNAAKGGFTDQTGVPGSDRVQQFAVFFSDGQPTCFSGKFKYRNTDYDAVSCSTDNCRPWQTCSFYHDLGYQYQESWLNIDPLPTGTGLNSNCCRGFSCWNPTTKWYIFETRPVSGYAAEYCNIPESFFTGPNGYPCSTARAMALKSAQDLKAQGVLIYVIGLGSSNEIDVPFLQSLSSGSGFTYIAPTSSQLQAIFQAVAKDIKLRLVY
jgi:Flp pilus assembly protein TadG